MPGYDAFSESESSKKLGREGALGYNSEKNYGQFSRHKNGVTAAHSWSATAPRINLQLIHGCTHPGSIKPDEFTGKPDNRDKSLASKHKDFIPLYAKITRDNISIDQSVFLSHSIYLRYLDEVLAGAGLCEFSCIFAGRSDDAQALSSQSRRYLKNVLFYSVAGLHLSADLVRPSRQSKTGRPIVDRWLLKMLERIFRSVVAFTLLYIPGAFSGPDFWRRTLSPGSAYGTRTQFNCLVLPGFPAVS